MLFFFASLSFAQDWSAIIGEALIQQATEELRAVLDESVQVELEELGLRAKSLCSSVENVQIAFRSDEDFQGPIRVWASLFENDVLCQKIQFQSRLKILARLPVAQKSVVAQEDVSISYADVRYDQLHGTPISNTTVPWIARTNIRKMEPLTKERVKLKPMNSEGDHVTVVLRKKGIEIVTKGKLLSDAQQNSRVRVFVLATNTVLDGILIRKDMIEVIGEKP